MPPRNPLEFHTAAMVLLRALSSFSTVPAGVPRRAATVFAHNHAGSQAASTKWVRAKRARRVPIFLQWAQTAGLEEEVPLSLPNYLK